MTWGRDRTFRAAQRLAMENQRDDLLRRLADREERLAQAHAAIKLLMPWRDVVVECCERYDVRLSPDAVLDVAAAFGGIEDALERSLTPTPKET